MRTLFGVFLFLATAVQAHAGLIFIDLSNTTQPQHVTGVIDTVANNFTINTFTPPSQFGPWGVPANLPLVMNAYQQTGTNTVIAWDIPDAATFAQVKTAIDTGPQMFLLPGFNNSVSWQSNGALINSFARAGWGGGGSTSTISDGSSAEFLRWPSTGSSGGSFTFNVVAEVTAVPEPSSMAMVGVVGVVVAVSRLRKKRHA